MNRLLLPLESRTPSLGIGARLILLRGASSLPSGDEDKRVRGINLCPKECLCTRKDVEITYKNVRLLSQFVSSQTGMILPRTITKFCRKKQQEIGKEIKLARSIGFMPYTYKAQDYLEDPKLFK